MCVGDLIRQKRQELNLSQEELGRMVGVNRAAINKWESGRVKNLKRETIKKLSEIFNISPALLVEPETPAPAGVELTPHEQEVLAAYRAKAEMQKAVDTLLGVAPAPASTIADDMKNTIALGEAVFGKTRTDAK